MAFFADLPGAPEPEPGPGPLYRDTPGSQPEHWLPAAVSAGAVVGRSDHTVVRLDVRDAYPRGLALELRAWLSPDGGGIEELHLAYQRPYAQLPFVGDLRLGLQWPDGTNTEAKQFHRPEHGAGPALTTQGGGGGGLTWRWHLWLHPLPDVGPVTVYCRWDGRGIAETATTLDLTAAVQAAAGAEELWHLPTFEESPPEGGWFSYSPMGSFSTLTALSPEASGDASDPGDEDG